MTTDLSVVGELISFFNAKPQHRQQRRLSRTWEKEYQKLHHTPDEADTKW